MKNLFQRLLIIVVSKLSVIVGEIHLPFSRKLITGSDYRDLMNVGLEEGDIILSLTHGELGNPLIPGHFSHVCGIVGAREIVEAVGTGVRRTDIVDFFMNKDQMVALRPKFANREQKLNAVWYWLSQVGKPYNFDLKLSKHDEKHYCCELIYKGYNKAVPDSPFTLRKTLGIETVVPDDFLNASSKWEIIWESKSYKDRK